MSIKNTLFIGKVLLHLPELPSTNSYAQDLLSKTTPIDGTVISTYNQTAGKGQIGSKWESQALKNLTLSIITYPNFLIPRQQFWLTQATALAVRDFISAFIRDDIFIKWPNDLYIKDSKTSGILTQTSISGQTIQYAVIGIGINVNQTQFSPSLTNATSLKIVTGQDYVLDDLREQLCLCFEQRYLQLRNNAFDTLQEDYFRHLYRINEIAPFESSDGQQFQGIIRGITPNGQLIVEHNDRLRVFDNKAIRFL